MGERGVRGLGVPVVHTGNLGRRAALVPLSKMQHHTPASTTWIIATGIADEIVAAARLEESPVQVVPADRACWDALACFRAALESSRPRA
ncbi:hypothetical protein AB0M42_05095 [Streptomyces sp. NPDC051784]|uniref:hypothetical protein n=1 Tax=Streptomyces sp. NPDC051784 TaxID=3155805 RepID=UPI0034446B34